MSYKCEFHVEVEEEYIEAYVWYETQKKGLGDRFLAFIRKKLDQIAENPEHYGKKIHKEYREVKVDIFPYVIVYKIYKSRKIVFINSIHHTRKRPARKYRK